MTALRARRAKVELPVWVDLTPCRLSPPMAGVGAIEASRFVGLDAC